MSIDSNEQKFKKKIEHAVLDSNQNNKVTLFNFLDEREQSICQLVFKEYDFYNFLFLGGHDDAEYKRLLISPYNIKENALKVVKLEISYNKKYLSLSHRKVLGSLMSLGIKREVVGDILIGEVSYIICTKEISGFIIDELKSISGVPVVLKEIEEINERFTKEYKEKIVTCASLRLDLVLSKMYNLSRSDTKDMVMDGFVKINHEVALNPTVMLQLNDVLSIKHKGRMKLLKIEGKTKKNKIRIILGKLV